MYRENRRKYEIWHKTEAWSSFTLATSIEEACKNAQHQYYVVTNTMLPIEMFEAREISTKWETRSIHLCQYSGDNSILQEGRRYKYQITDDIHAEYDCRYIDEQTGQVAFQFHRYDLQGVWCDFSLYVLMDKYEMRVVGGPNFEQRQKYVEDAKSWLKGA